MNKHILLKEDRVDITKAFAENNLSIHALRCASLKTDKYYSWVISGPHFILYYELPSIFCCDLPTILNELSTNVPDYFEGMDLGGPNVVDKYIQNKNRKLVYRASKNSK